MGTKVNIDMDKQILVTLNELLDRCRALAMEGYIGDISTAKENLKKIQSEVLAAREIIFNCITIGEQRNGKT